MRRADIGGGPLRVVVFDDQMFARGDLRVDGIDLELHPHGDDAAALCTGPDAPALVCVDYSMGGLHRSGDRVVRALRDAGYTGRVVAISSDPTANAAMIAAGADQSVPKAELPVYLRAVVRRADSA